jgi:hypothetical protein
VKPVLVDSDILIEVSRGRDEQVADRWLALSGSLGGVLCSPVTVAEIWCGARPREHAFIESLFSSVICVPIGEEIGRRAGEYLAIFGKSHNLELGDALIAATASSHSALLWTRNRKHYPMKDLEFY